MLVTLINGFLQLLPIGSFKKVLLRFELSFDGGFDRYCIGIECNSGVLAAAV